MNKMEETSTSDDDKAYEEVTTNQQMGMVGMSQSVKGETMGRMLAVSDHEDTRCTLYIQCTYVITSAIM